MKSIFKSKKSIGTSLILPKKKPLSIKRDIIEQRSKEKGAKYQTNCFELKEEIDEMSKETKCILVTCSCMGYDPDISCMLIPTDALSKELFNLLSSAANNTMNDSLQTSEYSFAFNSTIWINLHTTEKQQVKKCGSPLLNIGCKLNNALQEEWEMTVNDYSDSFIQKRGKSPVRIHNPSILFQVIQIDE